MEADSHDQDKVQIKRQINSITQLDQSAFATLREDSQAKKRSSKKRVTRPGGFGFTKPRSYAYHLTRIQVTSLLHIDPLLFHQYPSAIQTSRSNRSDQINQINTSYLKPPKWYQQHSPCLLHLQWGSPSALAVATWVTHQPSSQTPVQDRRFVGVWDLSRLRGRGRKRRRRNRRGVLRRGYCLPLASRGLWRWVEIVMRGLFAGRRGIWEGGTRGWGSKVEMSTIGVLARGGITDGEWRNTLTSYSSVWCWMKEADLLNHDTLDA